MNDTNFSLPSLSSRDSDLPESLTVICEGYDYVFVPPFGPGYECPICLLILREPRQTKCGHRFCRDCISHWLRDDSSNRCPVDNEPLADADIFPDNCIRREILSSQVKCPNHGQGCQQLTTISQMQKHREQCLLSLVTCPLNCPCVVTRRDLEDHKINHCENRMITCQRCNENMPAGMLRDHTSKCPKEEVRCTHCDATCLREEMPHHVKSVCKNVIVPCPFHALGCKDLIPREMEAEHLSAQVPSHLKMLSTSYNAILQSFSSMTVGLRQLNKQIGTAPKDEASRNSLAECISDAERWDSCDSGTLKKERYPNSEISPGQSDNFNDGNGAVRGIAQRSTSHTGESVFQSELNQSVSVVDPHPYHSMPLGASANDETGGANINSNNIRTPKVSLTGSKSVPILFNQRSVSDMPTPDQGLGADMSQPSISEFASSFQELCAHQQSLLEMQQAVVSNLCSKLVATESRLKQLEEGGVPVSSQNTCGDFYWSINDFSVLRDKALKEETSILHSPSFYSSPWGYKLCLRVNINGTLNSQAEHYVSLFIHFMRGTNDHVLNWPFSGQILLSIIDQNPSCKDRRHTCETLKARPEIAAFQKPTSMRNHKGFGYTDFISLNVLNNGNFVCDDTLIIRAQVFPSPA